MMREYLKEFFDDFTPSMMEDLISIARVVELKKNSILFFEGEKPINLHLLAEGSLYVYKSEDLNKIQILRHFYPVCLVAELSNVQNIPYPATAKCEEDAKIITINYHKYQNFFCYNQNYSHIAYGKLINSISEKLSYHVNKSCFSNIVELPAIKKIAMLLGENIDYFNKQKKWKIAQELRIAPETLSRNLVKLKELGAIDLINGKVEIISKNLLNSI